MGTEQVNWTVALQTSLTNFHRDSFIALEFLLWKMNLMELKHHLWSFMSSSVKHIKGQLKSHFCTLSEQTTLLIVLFKIIREKNNKREYGLVIKLSGSGQNLVQILVSPLHDFISCSMHVICAAVFSFVKWENNSNMDKAYERRVP